MESHASKRLPSRVGLHAVGGFNGDPSMSRTFRTTIFIGVTASYFLFGCATSEKVQVVKPGDPNLSCTSVKDELAKLDKAQADIDGKKGMTGTNVAAALFFLPGLAYTYYDAGEAQRLISDRRNALTTIYNNKKCTN